MPKLQPGTIWPTALESVAIDCAIAGDANVPELTADWFAGARPASDVLPKELHDALVGRRSRGSDCAI